ncbi:MAG: GspH/FimT family pseudopilin [Steroidobacteraceae bacterium]
MERPAGHTLPELVFVLAIVAGLAGWGVPAFQRLQREAAQTAAANLFLQAVHHARAEAVKRNAVVSLCPSLDGGTCAPAVDWGRGWIEFVNTDRDSPAVRDLGEELLQAYPGRRQGSIVSNRTTLSFRPYGQSGVTATVTFCDDRGSAAARAVIISQSGRPRLSTEAASGGPLTCA